MLLSPNRSLGSVHSGRGTLLPTASHASSIRDAFTLVELLVVITVIVLLVGLLLPAVQSARESARRAQCVSRLGQLATSSLNYHALHDEFPPGLDQFEASGPPRYRGTSLFAFLLPYIEDGLLKEDWDYDAPLKNTDGGLAAPTATVIATFVCPSARIKQPRVNVAGRWYGLTSYAGNGGSRSYQLRAAAADGVFHTTGPAAAPQANQRPISVSDIIDGSSHTFLFGERSHADVNYETFAKMYWGESLGYLGRWAAIGGRKRIADVTLSGYAPLNYALPFSYDQRATADPPLASSRDFAYFEDLRKCAYGSQHPGGANFARADGSVRFHTDSISPMLLLSYSTRAGDST